jgi:hypothetical protein
MKTAGGSWIDMIGLGQPAFAWGDLVWPELKSTGLTDWLVQTIQRKGQVAVIQLTVQSTVPQVSTGLKRQRHALESGQYNCRGNCVLLLLTHRQVDDGVLWWRRQQRSTTTNRRPLRAFHLSVLGRAFTFRKVPSSNHGRYLLLLWFSSVTTHECGLG